jgi:hypothetical protein
MACNDVSREAVDARPMVDRQRTCPWPMLSCPWTSIAIPCALIPGPLFAAYVHTMENTPVCFVNRRSHVVVGSRPCWYDYRTEGAAVTSNARWAWGELPQLPPRQVWFCPVLLLWRFIGSCRWTTQSHCRMGYHVSKLQHGQRDLSVLSLQGQGVLVFDTYLTCPSRILSLSEISVMGLVIVLRIRTLCGVGRGWLMASQAAMF